MTDPKLLLRIGLAFVFLYAAISSLISPADWIWYIPQWMQRIIAPEPMLMVHGIFELVLGVWLLSGWKTFYAAAIAACDLLAITLFNIQILSVVFRDVGLFFMAASLASLYKDQVKLFK
jgi:uncharacterized membrane protein YphA (DoxX/SURF4 family)